MSAKQKIVRSFVTLRGRKRHEHVFLYFYIHKDVNSTIYRYMLHLSGKNQPGEPVPCLEHSGNALISNLRAAPNVEKSYCPKGICSFP